jgi:hypothetical protein
MDWIDLAQDGGQVEVSCEHGNELSNSIKYWEVLECLDKWGFSIMIELHDS